MRNAPATLDFENSLWCKNLNYLVGIDEVGRGAWAGPLVAGAVIFPPFYKTRQNYYDSKLLLPKEREKLAKIIQREALASAVGLVEVSTIIEKGLTFATQLAFRHAIENLKIKADHYLIDAFYLKSIPKKKQTPIVRGDALCASIAAASIIAKVYRDNLMRQLGKDYLDYKFHLNKGYGTKAHQEAILKFGLSPVHRTNYNLKILNV